MKKKKKQMMIDYPEILNKFVLFLGAGMTVKAAWQKISSDYEKGKVRIPVECLIQLAKFYDVDMNYITGVSDTIHPFPKA